MFIESKGRILDAEKLCKDQFLLKKLLEWEAEQILVKYGFEKLNEEHYKNDEILMKCTIRIKSDV